MTPRGWAAVTLGALVIALIGVALARVPWSAPPSPRADQRAALHDLPAEAVARGKAFRAAIRPGAYGALLVGLVIVLALGLSPLGARLVELVGRPFGDGWLVQAVFGGFAVVLVAEVATLPLAVWRQSVLRRYGMSTQTWRAWTSDLLKGYAVGAVIGALALLGFFGVARLAPHWWWAWVAAGAAAFTVLASLVFPVLIEPLFNKFTPMPAGPLRDSLLGLASRDGVAVSDVLVADASRRTNALNGYVSGLGPTRRIVVFDTLLREAPGDQVQAVVAHELAHAKARDVVTATSLGALGAAGGVCAVYLLGSWAGLLGAAGVDAVTDPRAVALLIAVAALAGIITAPLQSLVSRRIEAHADAHALALVEDPGAVERMAQRLAVANLADVDPPRLEYLMFATHPSVIERIAAARAYVRGQR